MTTEMRLCCGLYDEKTPKNKKNIKKKKDSINKQRRTVSISKMTLKPNKAVNGAKWQKKDGKRREKTGKIVKRQKAKDGQNAYKSQRSIVKTYILVLWQRIYIQIYQIYTFSIEIVISIKTSMSLSPSICFISVRTHTLIFFLTKWRVKAVTIFRCVALVWSSS